MPTSQVKPFDIPKQTVWEAYRRVAANEVPREWIARPWTSSKKI